MKVSKVICRALDTQGRPRDGLNVNDAPGLFYQYHHIGPLVANSSYGVNKVDADSIYRIGSISKLLTIYLFLLSEGDVRWSDPVTKHLPQLLQYKTESWNDVTPDWESITVGDLAGQMAGLARDCT